MNRQKVIEYAKKYVDAHTRGVLADAVKALAGMTEAVREDDTQAIVAAAKAFVNSSTTKNYTALSDAVNG